MSEHNFTLNIEDDDCYITDDMNRFSIPNYSVLGSVEEDMIITRTNDECYNTEGAGIVNKSNKIKSGNLFGITRDDIYKFFTENGLDAIFPLFDFINEENIDGNNQPFYDTSAINGCFPNFNSSSLGMEEFTTHLNITNSPLNATKKNINLRFIINSDVNMNSNAYDTIKKDIVIHNDKRQYKCDICELPFLQYGSLNRHLVTDIDNDINSIFHTKENKCEIKIVDGSTNEHVQNSKFFTKDICHGNDNTECFPEANLSLLPPVKKKITTNRNKNKNKNEKPYHTEEFTTNNDEYIKKKKYPCEKPQGDNYLKKNMVTHIKCRPYECRICSKTFSKLKHLNRHFSIHTLPKLHKCGVCGRLFLRKRDVKRHMTAHEKKKLFECNICLKTYKRKDSLKKHFVTHTNSRPSLQ